MKFKKFIPILIVLFTIGSFFVFCGDDDDDDPVVTATPTLTPVTPPLCSTDAGGLIMDMLYNDLCLFIDYTDISEEDACGLGEDIDSLWNELCTQMGNATFDSAAVEATIGDILSDENIAMLKPLLLDMLVNDGAALLDDCGGFYEVRTYVDAALDYSSAFYTDTICSYYNIIGLASCEDAYDVISDGVNALDETLGLLDALNALGITSADCTFTADPTCAECVEDVWDVLLLALEGGTETEWDTAIDALLSGGVVDDVLADVIGLLKGLHDKLDTDGRTTLSELLPQLPTMLIGLLADEIESQCPAE